VWYIGWVSGIRRAHNRKINGHRRVVRRCFQRRCGIVRGCAVADELNASNAASRECQLVVNVDAERAPRRNRRRHCDCELCSWCWGIRRPLCLIWHSSPPPSSKEHPNSLSVGCRVQDLKNNTQSLRPCQRRPAGPFAITTEAAHPAAISGRWDTIVYGPGEAGNNRSLTLI